MVHSLQYQIMHTNNFIDIYLGITMESMEGVNTTMADVHNRLRKIISSHTILVGHSLDCDLRALQIIHTRVIDTAALYPHSRGAPYKQSLKRLALDHLCRVVQADSGSTGHDSVQGHYLTLSCNVVIFRMTSYRMMLCRVM